MLTLGGVEHGKTRIAAEVSRVNHGDSFYARSLLIAHFLGGIMEGGFVSIYRDLVMVIFALIRQDQEIRVRI
jgi:hypothetical protein